ncbi:MAG: thiamine-phosphate kinase [Thiogranum sp.]|nr:thiamine-phosphate kinase [Thiogranum sp.]
MTISEFDVIARFFTRSGRHRDDVLLGIGDDAALLQVAAGRALVVAMDTLVAGRHFPGTTNPEDIGFKSLAVNLSDLAAMGAAPAWATLSLTIPAVDERWLEAFASGFFELADRFGVELVGGDTTRGPLSVTVQAHGLIDPDKVLRRDRARPGQKLFVTGTLGDAALALHQLSHGEPADAELRRRLDRPEPRVAFGAVLAQLGRTAAIDVSDGLLADLGHLLDASGCGASIQLDRLPKSPALAGAPDALARDCQLAGGDDYELCFTLDADAVDRMRVAAAEQSLEITEIGCIEALPGIRCLHEDGSIHMPQNRGFDHFGGA